MSDELTWFHARGKEKRGPFTWDQLRALALNGEVLPADMLLRQGDTRWLAARDIEGLFTHPSTDVLDPGNTVSLAASATESPTISSTEPRSEPASDSPAAVNVFGYDVLEELGRGGMGVVYMARQKGLKRLVALKMILDSTLAGGQERERFRLEAESIAQLQHPNIVQIYEVGEHEGRPYFSLEYVDGGSLKERLAGIPLPPLEAARLAETLARAIAYAHQQGVIHRDLKPANVLLAACGLASLESPAKPQAATPKIADFGLAKQLDDDSSQTRTGAILGTPSYMAPEQALGQTDAVGPLSDVYSLGAILYEMLTGRPPFRAASILETLDQVRTREPVAPVQLQATVPRDLDTICLKCLHKEPRKRYATALELAEDLRRFLDGRPILARPIGPAARLVRWGRRNPAIASLLSALAIVIVVAFGLVTWKWREALDLAERETQAREQEQEAKEEARREGNEAHRRSAVLLLERALAAAREVEIQQALFWLTDGLAEAIKANDVELEHALRLQLGALSRAVPVRTGYLPFTHVDSLARSRDGNLLLAGWVTKERKGIARLWDVVRGQPLGSEIHHDFALTLVALSPDGTSVLTALDYGIEVRDARTSKLRFGKQMPGQNISAAAFSPDGKLVMIGSDQGKSQCFDAVTGAEASPLLTQEVPVTIIVFSPGSARVVTGGNARLNEGPSRFQVWELPSFNLVGKPIVNAGILKAMAFAPDGRTILAGYHDGKVQFWSTLNGTALGGDLLHTDRLQTLAVHQGGRYLATGGTGMKQHLLRPGAAGGLPNDLSRILFRPAQTDVLAYSPDGGLLLAAGAGFNQDGGQVRLWLTGGNQQHGSTLFLPQPITDACFLAGGRSLAALTNNGDVALWQTIPETRIGQLDSSEDASASITPDGRRALLYQHRTLRLWDLQTGQSIGSPIQPVSHALFSLSPDGRWFAVNNKQFEVTLVGVEGNRLTQRVLVHPGQGMDPSTQYVDPMEFSRDSRWLATGSPNGQVQLWDVAAGRPLGKPLPHEGNISRLAFSPDGRTLFVNRPSKATFKDFQRGGQLWNVATGTAGPFLDVPPTSRAVFSPDGKLVYVGSYDGEVLSRKVDTGEAAGPIITVSSRVQSMTLSGDGSVLLVGCLDGSARAWRTDTWQPISRALQTDQPVACVALSHDGRLALTGSLNRITRLWDVYQGRSLGTPFVVSSSVGVGFSGDGKRLLLAGRDGVVRVHPVPVPIYGSVERIRRWIEVTTGTEMDEHDSLRPLDRKTWEQRQRELTARDELDRRR